MRKAFTILATSLLLVGLVSAITWNKKSISMETIEPQIISYVNEVPVETHECSNEEWNSYFSDYRNGLLTREETLSKLEVCNRWQ